MHLFFRQKLNKNPRTRDLPEDYNWIVKPDAIEAFVRRVREEFPGVTLTADVFAGNGVRSFVVCDF